MRDNTPGDLDVRLSFARNFEGELNPRLEITDGTSGKTVTVFLNAADIAELVSGHAVEVTADRVTGFKAFRDFGKVRTHITRYVQTGPNDWKLRESAENAARKLPHVAEVIAEMEADGYLCGTPRRNNNSQWVIIGRRYDEPA